MHEDYDFVPVSKSDLFFCDLFHPSVSLVLSLVRIGYGSATFVLRWRRFTLKYRHMATMQSVESR